MISLIIKSKEALGHNIANSIFRNLIAWTTVESSSLSTPAVSISNVASMISIPHRHSAHFSVNAALSHTDPTMSEDIIIQLFDILK